MQDQPELRYRDCPTTQADLVIAAPPPVVWALVCDIQLPARFSSEFDGGQWLDGASRPALGVAHEGGVPRARDQRGHPYLHARALR